MTFLSEYTSLINAIVKETNDVKIFKNKCLSTASVLEEILKEFQKVDSSLEVSQDDKSLLNEYLQKLSTLIRSLQSDEEVKNFLNSQMPIQQPVTEINECVDDIISLLNKYDLLKTFKMPSVILYNDFVLIDELLTNPSYQDLKTIQERRQEIDDSIKQIQKPDADIDVVSNDEDIFATLNEFYNYKLNPTDYIKKSVEADNELFTTYLGEKTIGSKEKVRIMVLHDTNKFKRIFSILTTIRHPYLESFVGACATQGEVEIVTLKAGAKLQKLFQIDEYLDDDENGDLYDDSENTFVYLEPGDRTIIAFKIAQAMAFLHSHGVIHRDLSSNNIFIKKVADKEDENKYEIIPIITNFANSHLLSRNSILGMTNIHMNPSISSFIAPELTDTPNYDEKVDVFAFGGILYELLTDKSPYDEISNAGGDVWKKVKDSDRPAIPDYCSDELRFLIEMCWNQAPEQRPSFHNIVDYMLPNEGKEIITFPSDIDNKESIKKFYEQYTITSNSIRECLDTFDQIIDSIGDSYQYRFEFFHARPIISNYQYLLTTSKYPSLKNPTEQENKNISNLSNTLKELNEIILNASYNKWLSNALDDVTKITKELNHSMNQLFESMKNLGIEVVSKYEENKNDLVFDYRQLLNDFQGIIESINSEINECTKQEAIEFRKKKKLIIKKKKEIDLFFNEKDLDSDKSDDVIRSQIKDLFSQFSEFEKNEDDYFCDEPINSGISSIVYEGTDEKTDKTVAIKILNESYLKLGECSLIPLSREIAILTRLKHDYIAKFIGYVIPKDKVSVWFISEFISNGSLYKNKSELDGNNKTKIAFEIAEAMEYIHAQRILHRDLKSDNILIDLDYSPKIIDFGYSRSDIKDIAKTSQRGTYNYMAPEVINGGDYGSEADVFSYGMILWEMIMNKVPYENLSGYQIQSKIRKGVNLKFDKKCPENLKNLVTRCYNKEQSCRPSFTEIIETMMNRDDPIMFYGANAEAIRQFYADKAKKRDELKQKNLI